MASQLGLAGHSDVRCAERQGVEAMSAALCSRAGGQHSGMHGVKARELRRARSWRPSVTAGATEGLEAVSYTVVLHFSPAILATEIMLNPGDWDGEEAAALSLAGVQDMETSK